MKPYSHHELKRLRNKNSDFFKDGRNLEKKKDDSVYLTKVKSIALMVNGSYPDYAKSALIKLFPTSKRDILAGLPLIGVRIKRNLFDMMVLDRAETVKRLRKLESRADPHLVYLISDGSCVKIGITSNISSRLLQLQTGNPRRLTVVSLYESSQFGYAKEIESALHGMLRDDRLMGEWFSTSLDEAESLIKAFVDPLKHINRIRYE